MLPEIPDHERGILASSKTLSLSDLKFGMNWPLFETEARPYRPFSSYFEILDTRFRVAMWRTFVPHPSLSLTWVFTLFLSPILFFRFIRSRGISEGAAVLAVAILLASPGTLSVTAMLFRPAKAMTNFALIFILYWGAKFEGRAKVDPRIYVLTLAMIFVSFFWDETALIIYPIFFILFFELVTARLSYLASFLVLPALTYLTYFKLIPAISAKAGFPIPDVYNYTALDRAISPSFRMTLKNFALLIRDSLGVAHPALIEDPGGKTVLGAAICSAVFLALFFLARIPRERPRWNFTARVLLCLVVGGLFHTFAMNTTQAMYWGIYYYGIYWSVLFSVFGAIVFETLYPWRKAVLVATAIWIVALFFNFTYTNNVYRRDVPEEIRAMFDGRLNRFSQPVSAVPGIYSKTEVIWNAVRKGRRCATSPGVQDICLELLQ